MDDSRCDVYDVAMCIYLCCFWCIIYSSQCVFFSFLSGEIVALVRYRLFCFLFFGLVIIGVKSFGGGGV